MALLLSELCRSLGERGLRVRQEGRDVEVRAVNTLQDAGEGELSFLSNPKYTPQLSQTAASAVILAEDAPLPPGLSAIRTDDPYLALTHSVVVVHGYRRHPSWGVHAGAFVDPTAVIGEGANLAPGCHVGANAVLGAGCTLYPGAFVGEGARLGDGCTLYPNVVVYERCRIGDRCTLHSGTVIGQDGLGYAPVDGRWVKIPQVGVVEIGDDVEIGANCAIDRATLGRTMVGSGTKFGNANVIGHGTRIGRDNLFVGQVGLAGSVTVGDRVTFAGQTGSVGHNEVGDDASIAARAMLIEPVPPQAKVLGAPAQPFMAEMRAAAAYKRLPALLRTVAELRREVAALRERLARLEGSPPTDGEP